MCRGGVLNKKVGIVDMLRKLLRYHYPHSPRSDQALKQALNKPGLDRYGSCLGVEAYSGALSLGFRV